MQINTQGAQGRLETTPCHTLARRNAPMAERSGKLTQDHLRRLVASMVD